MTKLPLTLITCLLLSPNLMAENNNTEALEDMSDPLAVYTRGGIGFTNKGLNIKMGIQYDSGDSNINVMNVLEIKGIAGDTIGWDGPYERSNSVDSLRFRNFSLDKADGSGTQIDITYNFHSESGVASYSFMQGFPRWNGFNFYPLLGVGIAYANNALQNDGSTQSGLSIPGALAVVGLYGKYTVNENIWINYNPFWSVALVGSDQFMDHGFEDHSSVLTHEAAISYKITPRLNIRYINNWSEYTNFKDGIHRIESNYQF